MRGWNEVDMSGGGLEAVVTTTAAVALDMSGCGEEATTPAPDFGATIDDLMPAALGVDARLFDVVLAPALSTATAVIVYEPAATLDQVTLYGAVVSLPISVAPAKKSTRDTVPSLSLAFALTTNVAGAVAVAPLAGLVSDTVGGTFGAVTVTDTALDVLLAPWLSTATAVNV